MEQRIVAQVFVEGKWHDSLDEAFSTKAIDVDERKDGIGALAFVVDSYLVPDGKDKLRRVKLRHDVQYTIRLLSISGDSEQGFDAGDIMLDSSGRKGT